MSVAVFVHAWVRVIRRASFAGLDGVGRAPMLIWGASHVSRHQPNGALLPCCSESCVQILRIYATISAHHDGCMYVRGLLVSTHPAEEPAHCAEATTHLLGCLPACIFGGANGHWYVAWLLRGAMVGEWMSTSPVLGDSASGVLLLGPSLV